MGAAPQRQAHPGAPASSGSVSRRPSEHSEGRDAFSESASQELGEESSMESHIGHSTVQVHMRDVFDEWIDLYTAPDPEQQHFLTVLEESVAQDNLDEMITLPNMQAQMQQQDVSDELPLPTLLGRREEQTTARSLPNFRSLEERMALRRQRRIQTAPITSSQMLADALASDEAEERILRPPRVILTTPEGVHSMCLPQDCEARLRDVQAGLPAGPLLASQETCAVCLDEFRTGEQVQLMANCRHVFHAACIKALLQSQMPSWMACDCNVSCPLCRGPMVADSISQIPRRERRRAITLKPGWFTADIPTNDPISDSEDVPSASVPVVPTDSSGCKSNVQSRSTSLSRAGTAPLERSACATPDFIRRVASSHLEALGGSCEAPN